MAADTDGESRHGKENQGWEERVFIFGDVPNNVAVIYTCGYGSTQAVVPDNAKHAIRMLVSHWYRNREAASELPFREVPLTVDALLGNEMVPDYG